MTSAGEVAMGRDGVAEQLFLSTAIARRTLLGSFAIFGLRQSSGKIGEALEISEVAQCALQALCRPVQVAPFASAPEVGSFGKCFKHVPEAFDLDSQPVTAGLAQPSSGAVPCGPAVRASA